MNQMSVHRLYPATHTHGLCKYSVYSVLKFQWITCCLNSVTEIKLFFSFVVPGTAWGGGGGGVDYNVCIEYKWGSKLLTFILIQEIFK